MTPRLNDGTTQTETAVECAPAPGCATRLDRNGDALGYIPTCTSEPTSSGLRDGGMTTSEVAGGKVQHASVASASAPARGRLAEAAVPAAAAKLSHKVDE